MSDPQKRSFYNTHGKSTGNADSTFADPEEFFKSQFGGDKFTDIIGEISIAKDFKEAMSSGIKKAQGVEDSTPDESLSMEEKAAIKESRILTLVEKLKAKLSLYVDAFPVHPADAPVGSTLEEISKECLASFRAIAQMEADSLKNESYGVQLLHAIGYTYSSKGHYYISKLDLEEGHVLKKVWGLGSTWTGTFKEKAHIFSDTIGTVRTALDLQASFAKLQEMDKKGETTQQDLSMEEQQARQKLEFEAAQKGMEALWRGSKLEVESVLREVCDRTLSDALVDKIVLRRRAIALEALGQVYQSVKEDSPGPSQP